MMLEIVVASLCLIFGMSLHLVRSKNQSSVVIDYLISPFMLLFLKFGTCNVDIITEKMAEELVEMFKREVMLKVYSPRNSFSIYLRL